MDLWLARQMDGYKVVAALPQVCVAVLGIRESFDFCWCCFSPFVASHFHASLVSAAILRPTSTSFSLLHPHSLPFDHFAMYQQWLCIRETWIRLIFLFSLCSACQVFSAFCKLCFILSWSLSLLHPVCFSFLASGHFAIYLSAMVVQIWLLTLAVRCFLFVQRRTLRLLNLLPTPKLTSLRGLLVCPFPFHLLTFSCPPLSECFVVCVCFLLLFSLRSPSSLSTLLDSRSRSLHSSISVFFFPFSLCVLCELRFVSCLLLFASSIVFPFSLPLFCLFSLLVFRALSSLLNSGSRFPTSIISILLCVSLSVSLCFLFVAAAFFLIVLFILLLLFLLFFLRFRLFWILILVLLISFSSFCRSFLSPSKSSPFAPRASATPFSERYAVITDSSSVTVLPERPPDMKVKNPSSASDFEQHEQIKPSPSSSNFLDRACFNKLFFRSQLSIA